MDREEKTKPPAVRDFVPDSVVETARHYAEVAGLPKEASSSVVAAVSAYFGLKRLISQQQKLPPEVRKAMVSARITITDHMLKLIDQFVKQNLFPYNTLYVAPDGNIAVKASGWRVRGQADPRVFKGWRDEPTEKIDLADGNILFRKRVTACFFDGSEYPAEGWADVKEVQSRRAKTEAPPSFVAMIAETRAKVRALRDAIGVPYDIAEDVLALEEPRTTQFVEQAQFPEKGVSDKVPSESVEVVGMTIPVFLSRCYRDLGLALPKVLEKLGVSKVEEIPNLEKAYEQLEKSKGSVE